MKQQNCIFVNTGVSMACAWLIFGRLAVSLSVLMWEERLSRRCVSKDQVVQCSFDVKDDLELQHLPLKTCAIYLSGAHLGKPFQISNVCVCKS